jgi:hypothetical protein
VEIVRRDERVVRATTRACGRRLPIGSVVGGVDTTAKVERRMRRRRSIRYGAIVADDGR